MFDRIRTDFMPLLLSALIFLAPATGGKSTGAPVPNASSTIDLAPSPSTPISTEVRDFLVRPVDRRAFAQGLSLVRNRKDSTLSRKLTLDKLYGARKTMDAAQLRAFRDEALALAKAPPEPPALAAQAIGTMVSVNLLLLERGEISPEQAKQEAPFLLQVVQDPARDREVRGRAIRALSDLRITEAIPVLRQLLDDPENHNLPDVARNGCIALGRLSPAEAQPAIINVMSHTREPSVFGSGAFALGHIKTAESMAALVQLQDRFPDSGSCDAALAEMEEVILAELRNPAAPHLIPAIHATRHLWKQSQRDKYIPLLHGLLKTAPPPARLQAAERLMSAASSLDFADENRELAAILSLIADRQELGAYAERIRRRLGARPLTPTGKTIPVPSGASGK